MKPLIFVYDAGSKNSGSTVMRIFQLSQIAEIAGIVSKIVSNEFDFTGISESILLFSKNCYKWASENNDLITKIRNRNILCYDPLDNIFEKDMSSYFDIILASSITQYQGLSKHFSSSSILHHHDLFIQSQRRRKVSDRVLWWEYQYVGTQESIPVIYDWRWRYYTKDYRKTWTGEHKQSSMISTTRHAIGDEGTATNHLQRVQCSSQ